VSGRLHSEAFHRHRLLLRHLFLSSKTMKMIELYRINAPLLVFLLYKTNRKAFLDLGVESLKRRYREPLNRTAIIVVPQYGRQMPTGMKIRGLQKALSLSQRLFPRIEHQFPALNHVLDHRCEKIVNRKMRFIGIQRLSFLQFSPRKANQGSTSASRSSWNTFVSGVLRARRGKIFAWFAVSANGCHPIRDLQEHDKPLRSGRQWPGTRQHFSALRRAGACTASL
jgi:hypothetical protein